MDNQLIKTAMHDACIRAVTEISADVKGLVQAALDRETNDTAKSMLSSMLDNLDIAKAQDKAVCQSPGYPTTWISYGDGNFPSYAHDVICEALGEATTKGYLRPSFKGCGAELGNAMKIFTTANLKLNQDFAGLKRFVLETAINAGGKPCPPFGIGIGIGGQMDVASKLSREAISTRKWDDTNPDPLLARLEDELRDNINSLGLGAAGTGGDTVCLAVKIGRAATHTAIAPVAINFHCWVARRAGIRIYNDGRIEKLL